MNERKIYLVVFVTLIMLCLTGSAFSQLREYRIHDRGMIHETVYNTGTIGRSWIVQPRTNLPLMEWPPRSRTVINGIEYDGHHNIYGAGMYISANEEGQPGNDKRILSYCGGVGTNTTTELPYGKWSFPISMEEIENYPVLADGSLNPNYDPDKGEEIIIAKWATSTGVTVTRTSMAWSYPDYDDMIIYEYELEYTGDTDGHPATIERTANLNDVLFHVNYGFAPSQMAFFRWYGSWYYGDPGGIYRADLRYSFDPDYWLLWNTNTHTGFPDQGIEGYAAKPEPNPELFMEFAQTGKNGGGLLGAACPGYCMLYWDTNHLAVVDRADSDRNESEYRNYMLRDASGKYFELDDDGHVLQPWNMKCGTPNSRSSKMFDRACTLDERWWTVYGKVGIPAGDPGSGSRYRLPNDPETGQTREWKGRARFEWDECYNGGQANQGFGPYSLELGDKLEFVIAEVVGYGGTAGKMCCGGQTDDQFYPVRDWNRKVELNGQVMTEHYIDDFGYPDYINSDVVTVNQVAHKAHEAYLGQEIPFDNDGHGPAKGVLFPEDHPRPSENATKYQMPIPVPAPAIVVENTAAATVKLTWGRAVENFNEEWNPKLAGRLSGSLDHFNVYRADDASGPWELIAGVNVGEVNVDDNYDYDDTDQSFKLGETKYYAVTSVDENDKESGKTNFTEHNKNVAAATELGDIYAVPNPFVIESGFEGIGQEKAIGFYGLPAKATIKIFTFHGQLVETIEHDADVFSTAWFQVTRNNQDIASGVYFYVVTTPDGGKTSGKLVIVK